MKRFNGMTLLEVLVALAIFSLSALALLQSLGQISLGTGKLADKTWADWVAENQLVELRLKNVRMQVEWVSGESEQAGERWYWHWRSVGSGLPGVQMLEVEVARRPWEQGGTTVTVLRSYVVQQ